MGRGGKDRGRRPRGACAGAVRVVCGVAAVGAVAALAAGTVALAIMGDTVRSFLSTDAVDVSAERHEATMESGRALAERIEAEGHRARAQRGRRAAPSR